MEYMESAEGGDGASIGDAAAATSQTQMILCCTCGALIEPNPSNMCVACLRTRVDITEGIPKQCVVYWCKGCHRYLQKVGVWVAAQLESQELLALCLRKLKNLSKLRVVDASFLWTEPHSKRLRVRLVVQGTCGGDGGGAILEQTLTIEYVVQNYMCSDCHRVEARDYWKAVVQVRQRGTTHKKTFYYLEQCVIKHRQHTPALKIKELNEGLDFYFASKQDARKLVEFINTAVPSRSKTSEKLISHDTHSNTYNYKHTFSVDIVPVCKDHVVCLPPRLARQLGNIGQICVCYRVSAILYIIDPNTLQVAEVSSTIYWRTPFTPLGSIKALTEFTVLQCDIINYSDRHHKLGPHSNKHQLADVWVVRSCDLGHTDTGSQIYCRSHLGHLLNPGDTVLGFDFTNTNVNDFNVAAISPDKLPDVVLVKKVYGERSRRHKNRMWRLKRFPRLGSESTSSEVAAAAAGDRDHGMMEGTGADIIHKRGGSGGEDEEYLDFLEDLEETVEMRGQVDIYKDPSRGSGGARGLPPVEVDGDEMEEVPHISLQEMLDDLNIAADDDTQQ